ncbi:MAG: alpha/beta hydrolase [Thermoanaerobaculia bacterium]
MTTSVDSHQYDAALSRRRNGRKRCASAGLLAVVAGLSLGSTGLAGCAATARRLTAPGLAAAAATQIAKSRDGLFDVGSHLLYLRCEGAGSPTVVYLHGIIVTNGGSQSSGSIPGYLRGHVRVCVYDRANVGLSTKVTGPLTGNDSIRDLHTLLAAAREPGPYVLLGASFGGLLAVMYAATYPEEIAAMVLLDASLPNDPELDERFLPKAAQLQSGDWRGNVEQMDTLTTYRQAQNIQSRVPSIPLTYLAVRKPDLDPAWPVAQMTAAIQAEQHAFVARFCPGRLILRDVPHFMEKAIPREVANEVMRIIAITAHPPRCTARVYSSDRLKHS